MTGDEVLSIKPIDSNRSVPLPEVITVRTLLIDILDIGGWPKRRFYDFLSLCATDPAEKEELERLTTKEGKADYLACGEESYTYAELLAKYPSATPSVGNLIDYVPDIKPRLYSIASSSRLRGDDECHLCIIKNEWSAASGRGGRAQLELLGQEILDTGLQVVAQPPGKKNQTIHLLSGGEKALTAIALVFALFKLNPSPFCLMDEVDAPLDDSNAQRFCDVVKSMSNKTQFLFVSHNKITMEIAQQLIGVTMQEPGVSRIVEVDLQKLQSMELVE
jgi:hypothetical protein